MAKMEGETSLLRQTNASLQSQMESLKSEVLTLTEEVEELESSAHPTTAGDDESQAELQAQAYLGEIRALTEEVEDTEQQLRNKDGELRAALAIRATGSGGGDIDILREANEALEAHIDALTQKLVQTASDDDILLQQLRKENTDLQSRVKLLEQEVLTLSEELEQAEAEAEAAAGSAEYS